MSEEPLRTSFYQSLPFSPDLTHLKNEAKELKSRFNSGDASAVAFAGFHVGKFDAKLKLAVAQFAIAKSYGFKSWPRLKAFVESGSLTVEQRGELLLRAIFENNHALLQELYSQRQQLASSKIYLAAALGDLSTVTSLLADNRELATAKGGPRHTQAITYAAHAPFGLWDDAYRQRQSNIVRQLLEHGADPDSFVDEAGSGSKTGRRLSALYGCCRYPGNPDVAKLLLQAGANPNDGESLYHASELQDTRCLELLFEAGVQEEAREYCIRRVLDGENPGALELYLRHGTNPNHLDWALFRERGVGIIQLLIAHGADIDRVSPADHWVLQRVKGLRPVQIAERNGDSAMVANLLARGAIDARTMKDLLIGACARADRDAARQIAKQDATVVPLLTDQDHSNLAAFARAGRIDAVRLMLDIGFNIEARADDINATALLYAAGNGNASLLNLLLSRGASLDVKNSYGGDPLDSAIYGAAYFGYAAADYPAAVGCLISAGLRPREDHLKLAIAHDLDEVAEVLKAHGAAL